MLAGHQGAGDVWERLETEQLEACSKQAWTRVCGHFMWAFYKQLHLTWGSFTLTLFLLQDLAAFRGEGLIVHV